MAPSCADIDDGGMETRTSPSIIESLVDATPSNRDRVVDFVRAACIAVVVLWHWTFSITQWHDGRLSMPNPIGDTSGLWLLTWVFQVMPLFFVVGGFSNLAGWKAGASRQFVSSRIQRLGRPAGAMLGTWIVVDLALWGTIEQYRSVVEWGDVVFVPLWFLGTYGAITALVPITARLHQRAPISTLAALAGLVALGDLVRFAGGVEAAGLATTVAVWTFAHQLGYWWRDGTLTRLSQRHQAAMAAAGLIGLVVTTNIGVYPRSMVAVDGEWISNMFPTTAPVACLAVFQLGLVLLARPTINRWLRRSRRAWSATIAVNATAMTVFCWHMTALVIAIALWERTGGQLLTEATGAWWWQRPMWFVLPALVLAPIGWIFWPVEARRS